LIGSIQAQSLIRNFYLDLIALICKYRISLKSDAA